MQRLTRNVVVAIVAVIVFGGCWAQPGSDAERSGYSPLEHGITPANVAQLHVSWTKQLTVDVHEPLVTAAGVYATSGSSPSAGTLALLDRNDGTNLWNASLFAADSGFNGGSPLVLRGKVYAPTTGISPILGNAIHTFDAMTGAALPSPGSGGNEVNGRGAKIVGTATQGGGSSGVVATQLFVDDTVGTGTWSTILDVGSPGSIPSPTSAAVAPTRLVIGLGAGVASWPLAKPTNCQVVSGVTFCPPAWSTPLATTLPGGAHPVLSPDDATVYAAAGSSLVALDAATGTQLWAGTLGASAASAPAVGNGFVYVPTSSGELDVFKLDGCGQMTCTPQWHANTTSAISQPPAVVPGGLVYTASADGVVRAYPSAGCGTTTCTSLWSAATGSTITGGPVPALGNLYVGTADGRLIAYTL